MIDRRSLARVRHELRHILRFRMPVIAARYYDANNATGLRLDPVFKIALDRPLSGVPP